MRIEVPIEITIEVPAEEALALLSDMARNPEWQQGMVSCVWTSEPPLRVGSTYDQRARFLGRDIVSSFEVVELTEHHIRIQTTTSTMPLDITRTVEPLGEGACRVRARVCGDMPWFFWPVKPLMTAMVGRSVRADYARLKSMLEG